MYEVQGPDGAVSGPHSKATVVGWIRAGQLPRDAPVRLVGQSEFMPVEMVGELREAFSAKPGGGGGSALIPTGNPAALIAYYTGIVSCLPFLGLPVAILAIFQARKGLKVHRENPELHGKGHAVTGMVCGVIGLLINVVLTGALITAMASGKM